jgi:hypothetical protein
MSLALFFSIRAGEDSEEIKYTRYIWELGNKITLFLSHDSILNTSQNGRAILEVHDIDNKLAIYPHSQVCKILSVKDTIGEISFGMYHITAVLISNAAEAISNIAIDDHELLRRLALSCLIEIKQNEVTILPKTPLLEGIQFQIGNHPDALVKLNQLNLTISMNKKAIIIEGGIEDSKKLEISLEKLSKEKSLKVKLEPIALNYHLVIYQSHC